MEETCEAEKNIILKSSFFCYLVQSLTLFILVVGSPVQQWKSRVCMTQNGHPTDWLKKAVSHCPEIPVLFFVLLLLFCRFRASCEDGYVEGNGRPLCRITFVPLMLKVWGRGTRLCSPWLRPSRSTFTSSTSWSTASCGPCAWRPAPRSPPSATMMSAVFFSTGLSWHKLKSRVKNLLVFLKRIFALLT